MHNYPQDDVYSFINKCQKYDQNDPNVITKLCRCAHIKFTASDTITDAWAYQFPCSPAFI